MPAYDDNGFAPPAPVARVSLLHPDSGQAIANIRMLITCNSACSMVESRLIPASSPPSSPFVSSVCFFRSLL